MPLQLFKSTDTNAPVLTGQAGKLTDLLDTCLVDGYTTASVSGITRSSVTATATIAANTTLRTGDWVTISGANETDYNVTAQITVLSSTQFTYTVANSPTTPATGTILYKKAAAGWATAYTGTNVRAYRSPNTAGCRPYLRIDDNTLVNVREAYVRGYMAMTDINTGTDPFPTTTQSTNGLTWNKSSTADATARTWALIADDKTLYLFINPSFLANNAAFGFGHFNSFKPGDGFNAFIAGNAITNWTTTSSVTTGYSGLCYGAELNVTAANTAMLYIPRSYTQIGSCVAAAAYNGYNTAVGSNGLAVPFGGMTTATTSTALQYPNGPDSGFWCTPLRILDYQNSLANIRGTFPGVYTSLHLNLSHSTYDIIDGVLGLTGVSLVAIGISANSANGLDARGMLHIDITGPW